MSTLKRTQRARNNLAQKLILEARFKPEINSYFNSIIKSYQFVYEKTGQIISSDIYSESTIDLLKTQYNRVTKAFSKEMRNSRNDKRLSFKQDSEDDEIEKIINQSIMLFILKESSDRSILIIDTNNKDISDSTVEASEILQENDQPLTNSAIALLASQIMKAKFKRRVETIAITETQYSAERTKLIEAGAVSQGSATDPYILSTGKISPLAEGKKQWSSILDEVTRVNHVVADGQTVTISSPYSVGGEQLMHPGDSSLGASAGNIINCRCSSIYTA